METATILCGPSRATVHDAKHMSAAPPEHASQEKRLTASGVSIVLLSLLMVLPAAAQDIPSPEDSPPVREEAQPGYGSIGFMGLALGMSREQVLAAADASDLIQAPRKRDVEFFPIENRQILTLSVRPEIPFIYLQFFDDVLYAITVIFDDAYIDYLTLASSLGRRYGAWTRLQPDSRLWRVDQVTIRVEKPAVVKYIALEDFLKAADFSREETGLRRQRLLEGL